MVMFTYLRCVLGFWGKFVEWLNGGIVVIQVSLFVPKNKCPVTFVYLEISSDVLKKNLV